MSPGFYGQEKCEALETGKISREASEMVSDVSTGKWRYLSPLCFEIIGKTKSGE